MGAGRFRLSTSASDQIGPTLGASAGGAVLAYLATQKLGLAGLAAPFVVVLVVMIARRPFATLCTVVVVTVLFEGPTFGIPVTPDLYKNVYKGLSPLDGLVALVFFSSASDLLRRGRQPRLPPALLFPLLILTLATLSGIAVGYGSGIGLRNVVLSAHVFVYLLVIPFAVYNLDLDQQRLVRLIRWTIVLALFKAIVGLIVMRAGKSLAVDAGTSLTYYEPTANWVIMVAIFGLTAAGLAGSLRSRRWVRTLPATARSARAGLPSRLRAVLRPRWALLAVPVLVASVLLSYRRSFWVGTLLGLALVIVFASTPTKRLVIVIGVPLLVVAIWAIGAINFQAQTPLTQRVASLSPSSLTTNAEDRYRLDERANVIAEIRRSPIAGLGMEVPWSASARPLGIEHDGGRLYVHFAFVYWWLKLGLLGAAAYLLILTSAGLMAFRTWRQHRIPEFRYFGLASLCAMVGLVAIETTASFTGVDPRFTVVFAAQLGLLATLSQRESIWPGRPLAA